MLKNITKLQKSLRGSRQAIGIGWVYRSAGEADCQLRWIPPYFAAGVALRGEDASVLLENQWTATPDRYSTSGFAAN